jgi:DNA-directed RNA polymerase subunit RPC12/RpoP
MHAESDQPQQIECPRCGYAVAGPTLDPRDASGSVTCPECGLVSDARTLADDAALPRWFVESRTSDRGFARRFASTFARALQPLGFWRAVRMEHRFSARSLAGFIAGVLLAIHLCTAAAATLHVVAEASPRSLRARGRPSRHRTVRSTCSSPTSRWHSSFPTAPRVAET